MGSFCLTSEQESGTQVAIETIYRELERARNLSCGSGERVEEDQPFGDVDADWTLIDEEGDLQEAEVQTEVKTDAIPGIGEQARMGSAVNASAMLNSMVLSRQRQGHE